MVGIIADEIERKLEKKDHAMVAEDRGKGIFMFTDDTRQSAFQLSQEQIKNFTGLDLEKGIALLEEYFSFLRNSLKKAPKDIGAEINRQDENATREEVLTWVKEVGYQT